MLFGLTEFLPEKKNLKLSHNHIAPPSFLAYNLVDTTQCLVKNFRTIPCFMAVICKIAHDLVDTDF